MSPSEAYAVLLSGTHVTGKETLASALSTSLRCPWLKAEMCHSSATFGARAQAKRGYDYSTVFGRIWMAKMIRIGFASSAFDEGNGGESETNKNEPPRRSTGAQKQCTAVISCYHMRKPARDAIRAAMLANNVRAVFIVLQISPETLSGRTLGAEEPELATRIMSHKIADIEMPSEGEEDVLVVDSMLEVDKLFAETERVLTSRLDGED